MISLITVGMNHRRYIGNLYDSLFSEIPIGTELEAIYVDNCSTDDSVSFIREHYPQVKIIQNLEPLGFGENNNKGVRNSKGDCIGIINPDIVFTKGSLGHIIDMFKSHDNCKYIVAPRLLNPDKSLQYSVRRFATLKMMLHRWRAGIDDNSEDSCIKDYLYKDLDPAKTHEVDWAMGAALFMPRDVYIQLGGFDQRYFLYMEDEDLCLRAWKQEIPVLFYPQIELIHNHLRGSSHLSINTWWHLKSLALFYWIHGINVKRK